MGSILGFHSQHVDDVFPADKPGALDELLTAAESAETLLASPGWAAVSLMLARKVQAVDDKLDGQVLDQASYASLHGQRAGLRAAESAVRALIERAESRLESQRAKHEGAAEPALQGA